MVSKRGVVYASTKCNLRCKFCVLDDWINTLPQTSLGDLKSSVRGIQGKYGLEYIDLAGAEPTLNPDLPELLKYCNEIGLKPCIVTNGQLTKVIEKILPLLDDMIVSVHNIGKDYDKATRVEGSWRNLRKTLKLLKNKNFRFRINCHVYLGNIHNLKSIIDLGVSSGARIIDFIGFCGDKFENETVVTYSESSNAIKSAIEYARKYPELTINVRWIPLCMMKGFESHVIDWHQWIYDQYSWNEASGNNINLKTPEDYERWISAKTAMNYRKIECNKCRNRNICDGINPKYIERFGDKEFEPSQGEIINEMMFYRK